MQHFTTWAILATVVLAALIAALTMAPPSGIDMPGNADKYAHLFAFAALALPLSLVRPRWIPVLFIVLTAYGAAIEIIQPLVGRSRDIADLGADVVGILCGVVAGVVGRWLVDRASRAKTADEDEVPKGAL